MKKVVSILLIVMMITVSTVALAVDPGSIKGNTQGTDKIKTIGEQILGIVQVVGSIVAVIWLVILGIKYMMGSAEEKAEYKKTFIPYIIGAVLIFAASNLASMVYNWANSLKL